MQLKESLTPVPLAVPLFVPASPSLTDFTAVTRAEFALTEDDLVIDLGFSGSG